MPARAERRHQKVMAAPTPRTATIPAADRLPAKTAVSTTDLLSVWTGLGVADGVDDGVAVRVADADALAVAEPEREAVKVGTMCVLVAEAVGDRVAAVVRDADCVRDAVGVVVGDALMVADGVDAAEGEGLPLRVTLEEAEEVAVGDADGVGAVSKT